MGGGTKTIVLTSLLINDKGCTLASYRIQYPFSRDTNEKFYIPNSRQSPNFGQNSDGNISNFEISAQSLIKAKCHNYRTRSDLDMKIWPVTKPDRKNTGTSRKPEDDVMTTNI